VFSVPGVLSILAWRRVRVHEQRRRRGVVCLLDPFGYIVGYTGSYDAPFIPVVALPSMGGWVWLRVEPEHQVFAEDTEAAVALTT